MYQLQKRIGKKVIVGMLSCLFHVIITKVKSKGCHICQLRKKLIKRLKQILHINCKYTL